MHKQYCLSKTHLMFNKYLIFLKKKKILLIFSFIVSLVFSIFLGYLNSSDQNSKTFRFHVKINHQALFLSKDFVIWSKDTISKVYLNNNLEINSVEDLDAFSNIGENLKDFLFNLVKRKVVQNLDIKDFTNLEFKDMKNEYFQKVVVNKSQKNNYSTYLVESLYEEYIKKLLIVELKKFQFNGEKNIENIADRFFQIKTSHLSKNLLYDRVLFIILPFLIVFLGSLTLFYRTIYKK